MPRLKTLLISTPLFMGGLELLLRLTGYTFPTLGMPDRNTGWSLRPGAEGLVRRENKRGVYVHINSDGLRDREHTIPKPAFTIRIAVLGDSLCEATEVQPDETFWAIVERELSACTLARGTTIEVINFGVAGFSTAQELITLRTKVWKYQPDIVLLAFTGSDVSENHRSLSGQLLAPYFIPEDGRLALDDSFGNLIRHEGLRTIKAALAQRLRIVQLADELFQRRRGTSPPEEPRDKIYIEPTDPLWREAWHTTEVLIRAIHQETREHGAQLWIATMSNDIQVHPDRIVRQNYAKNLGMNDLFYPDRRIQSLGSREDIPVISLAEEMASWAEHNHAYLHGFQERPGYGHWNESGHRVAGKLIASRLCRDLPGPSSKAPGDVVKW